LVRREKPVKAGNDDKNGKGTDIVTSKRGVTSVYGTADNGTADRGDLGRTKTYGQRGEKKVPAVQKKKSGEFMRIHQRGGQPKQTKAP